MSDNLNDTVRERYRRAALRVGDGDKSECCSSSCCGGAEDPISSNLYGAAETALLPAEAVLAGGRVMGAFIRARKPVA